MRGTSPLATGIITLSWYSLGCVQFFRSLPIRAAEESSNELSPKHHVPGYIWDIYESGMNSGGNPEGADVVKGVGPKYLGPFHRGRFCPNHGKQEIKFAIPKGIPGERLVEAEIRIVTDEIRHLGVSLQIFHKQRKWVFLDAKTVPREGTNWIALKVMPAVKKLKRAPKELSFLMLSIFRRLDEDYDRIRYLRPLLLLSYTSRDERQANYSRSGIHLREMELVRGTLRRKRSIFESYEENTNRIWKGDTVSNGLAKKRNTCTRKPLYIEFSEINFDSWIVAPTGYEVRTHTRQNANNSRRIPRCRRRSEAAHIAWVYSPNKSRQFERYPFTVGTSEGIRLAWTILREQRPTGILEMLLVTKKAFQCVGKCTFPVSEHLSPTKHAIVQILMHHVSPTKVARACCVPTRLDPISVLYVDSEGILTYRFRYPDMVVAECGCR